MLAYRRDTASHTGPMPPQSKQIVTHLQHGIISEN